MKSKKILSGLYIGLAGVYVWRMFSVSTYPVATWELIMGMSLIALGLMKTAVEEMKLNKKTEELFSFENEIKEKEEEVKTKEIFLKEIDKKRNKSKEVI